MAASCCCSLFLPSSPSSSNASLLPLQRRLICRNALEAKGHCWRSHRLPRSGTSTQYTLAYLVRIPNTRCSRSAAGAIASMVSRKPRNKQVVVPDPDYRIPVVLLGLACGLVYQDNLLLAAPVGLLGLLLLFQTTRVRFVFDEEALEVKIGDQLRESGENVFVGGKNRWKYSTFVNWELWWPNFPILVYFKETQTKPEGQVHFFPVIFNGKQLYNVMVERAGPSKTSSPKES